MQSIKAHMRIYGLWLLVFTATVYSYGQESIPASYLKDLQKELAVKWPNNRTLNLVFHGHSVPTGYTTNGVVDRINSYPFQTLKNINDNYPYAVVNAITTSIGGEQSEQGSKRFSKEVLNHAPDVVFIDYALNDRSMGLERAKTAWVNMIETALEHNIKVILLTPTPDLKESISDPDSALAQHAEQIRSLAKSYGVGLVDSYQFFSELAINGNLEGFMAQNNHINQKGHQLVANLIFDQFFKSRNTSEFID